MAIFSTRPSLYKCAVGLLVASLILAAWGVIAPGWLEVSSKDGVKEYFGLRWDCLNKLSNCTLLNLNQASALEKATMGFSYIGLFFLGVSTLAVVFREACSAEDSHQKRSYEGMLAIGSGVILFTGCMIFVNDDTKAKFGPGEDFGPSFILTLVASLTSSLAGLVIVCYTTVGYWQGGRRGRPQAARVLSPYPPPLSTVWPPSRDAPAAAGAGNPDGNVYHDVAAPPGALPPGLVRAAAEGSGPYGQPDPFYPVLPTASGSLSRLPPRGLVEGAGDPYYAYAGRGDRGFRNEAYARDDLEEALVAAGRGRALQRQW